MQAVEQHAGPADVCTLNNPLLCRPACCSVAAATGREGNALHQCGSQQDIDDFLQLLNYQRAKHGWVALVANTGDAMPTCNPAMHCLAAATSFPCPRRLVRPMRLVML